MTPSSLTPQIYFQYEVAATTNENIQRCISTIAAWRQTAGRDGLLPSSVMKDPCLRRVLISTSSSAWWLQQHDTRVDLLYFPTNSLDMLKNCHGWREKTNKGMRIKRKLSEWGSVQSCNNNKRKYTELHFPNFPMRAHCRMRWAAAIQHDEVPCLSRQWISEYRIYFTTWIPLVPAHTKMALLTSVLPVVTVTWCKSVGRWPRKALVWPVHRSNCHTIPTWRRAVPGACSAVGCERQAQSGHHTERPQAWQHPSRCPLTLWTLVWWTGVSE